MNVSGSQFQGILKLYGEQTKVNRTLKTTATSAAKTSDSVVLSPKAQEFAGLLAKLQQTPEIRPDVVQRFSAQVENGEYRVDSVAVAKNLLAGAD
ncbi:flagellar biosynthesis anti-sigma factor FlgM [Anaeroarcus burkinensis]|uniref:flagellar biosynthesis anti-sigma factor FlgM n=1 Tax=Anaeroarcus burkinensis TaxID=82376 RepID=UPI0003FB374C|nr:flagellar biosynthesis anti-sigma factor FlgM [Anaeroarcus burkinensis]